MFQKSIFISILVFALILAPSAFAGKVELTTYYPSPYGEYTSLNVGNGTNTYPTTPGGTAAITMNSSNLLRMVMNDGSGNYQEYLNAYWDAASMTHKYVQSSVAANRFVTSGGVYSLNVAPSGTAGNTITWTAGLYIDNIGNVAVGTAPASDIAGTTAGDLTVAGSIVQDAWIVPGMTNGWITYDATFNPPAYFRDKNGIVHLRGMIKNGTINTAAFNLPAGYRPAYRELFVSLTSTGIGRCDVDAAGNVIAYQGGTAWFSLDGMSFRANGY